MRYQFKCLLTARVKIYKYINLIRDQQYCVYPYNIFRIIRYYFDIASCRTTAKALVYNSRRRRRRRRQPAKKRKRFVPVI